MSEAVLEHEGELRSGGPYADRLRVLFAEVDGCARSKLPPSQALLRMSELLTAFIGVAEEADTADAFVQAVASDAEAYFHVITPLVTAWFSELSTKRVFFGFLAVARLFSYPEGNLRKAAELHARMFADELRVGSLRAQLKALQDPFLACIQTEAAFANMVTEVAH